MADSARLTWQTEVNLWRDRFARRDVYKAFGFALLPLLIVYFMIVFEGRTVDPLAAAGWLALAGIIFLLVACLAARIIIPRRARMRFELNADAASMEMTLLPDDDLNTSVSPDAGIPGGDSDQKNGEPFKTTTIPWKNITAFREHPAERVISLHNEWRALLRLYCPSETVYQQALNTVRLYMPPAR
jgi:hypothetical protein